MYIHTYVNTEREIEREGKQAYLGGTGSPLGVKSFRKAQPQLSSPLSPVD